MNSSLSLPFVSPIVFVSPLTLGIQTQSCVFALNNGEGSHVARIVATFPSLDEKLSNNARTAVPEKRFGKESALSFRSKKGIIDIAYQVGRSAPKTRMPIASSGPSSFSRASSFSGMRLSRIH